MKKTTLSIAVIVISAMSLQATVISNFNFTGAPWPGAKEADFATFSAAAGSVDAELNTTTSDLSKTDDIDSGGYSSYYIRDSDISGHIFSLTDTPGVGMNFADLAEATATDYISFTVTTAVGFETTYENLTLFAGTNDGNMSFELRAYDGATLSTPVVSYSFVDANPGVGTTNDSITATIFDFVDFTSSEVIEFRLYAYGATNERTGARFDDIVLNGKVVEIPEPSSVALLLGLGGLALVLRRRK